MYVKYLKNIVCEEKQDIYKTHWQLYKSGESGLIVVDEENKFSGMITLNDIKRTYIDNSLKTASDICDKNCLYINDKDDIYVQARNLFAEYPSLELLPVLNSDRDIVDLMTRNRSHYRERFLAEKLPRMNYAYPIWRAALEAKALGYTAISVIEFGVAGGNGLVVCELHTKEISRILDINIEVYGFDSAEGLPPSDAGYKDLQFQWSDGLFPMNKELLEERLQSAKLVIGDIASTIKTFINEYNPAPIGAIFIDVDYYSSTLPVLKFMEDADHNVFIPRTYMYFDDTQPIYEFQGEALAIKEFNARNELMKISPEGDWARFNTKYYLTRVKVFHRFEHPKYNEYIRDSISARMKNWTGLN